MTIQELIDKIDNLPFGITRIEFYYNTYMVDKEYGGGYLISKLFTETPLSDKEQVKRFIIRGDSE